MKIDYSKTLSAYLMYDGNWDFLTQRVHEFVLGPDGLGKKSWAKRVMIGFGKIADVNKELLIPSYVGKGRYKVPHMRLTHTVDGVTKPLSMHFYDVERSKIIASALVTNVLLDNGTYGIREDVKRIDMKDGTRKFRKSLYIKLGGSTDRDLYEGIHFDPGQIMSHVNPWSRSEDTTDFLTDVSSVPFKIWDGATEDLMVHLLENTPDWDRKVSRNGKKLSEDRIAKHIRKKKYVDKVVNHVKKYPKFYLSGKFDDRTRFYYDQARLEGMRVSSGKAGEVMMIDSATGYIPGEDDAEVLRHIIYVNLHRKVSLDTANKKFTDADLAKAKAINPMESTKYKDIEKAILLNKAAQCYQDYLDGNRNYSLFGYDFTNSGLMMAGVSFHSKEMMKAGNLGGHKTVYDSHTEFGKGYGLDLERDAVKEIHTPLLHGSTPKTLAKILNTHLGEDVVDEHKVRDSNEKAYGDCVRNIETIADWGTLVTGNKQDILRWTMPDGWRASHRAHMDGVPVRVHAISARHKELYTTYVVTSNMPLCEDKYGIPIFNKDTELDGVSYNVHVSKRGLYANITHSIDAFVLRHVVAALVAADEPFLLKHDDYIVRPGARSIVLRAAQEAFDILYERNLYQEAIDEIAKHNRYSPLVPSLVVGNASNTAVASSNFLMP